MRMLIASTPATGHLNPLLSVARMGIQRGDDVLVTTGSSLASRVEAAGASFAPLRGEADIDFSCIEAAFPERASLPPGPEQLRFDFERGFIDPMPAQAETLRALIARFAPDLVVVDTAFLGRFPLVMDEDRARPPVAVLGITVLPFDRPDGAPVGLGLPPASDDGERARYAELARGVRAAFDEPVRAHMERVLAGMGISGDVPFPMQAMGGAADAYLQPTVRAFEYDFGPLPPSVHFVGALPPPPGIHAVRPDWWDRLDGSRPIILVTQGTAANYDFDQLVNPALSALESRDDVHVVVTTGGRPVESIRATARPNLFVAPFVDYLDLIPRLGALVTNGGYGTVSLALKSGVPIVAAGRTEDKAEVGARVAWSGAGIEIPSNQPGSAEVAAAVDRVLAEPSYRGRARAIGGEFAAIDTPRAVFAVLDRLAASPGRGGPSGAA